MNKVGNIILIIVVSSLCFSFIINSFMFVSEATRRTADEIQKINISSYQEYYEAIRYQTEKCVEAGGLPEIASDGKLNCR